MKLLRERAFWNGIEKGIHNYLPKVFSCAKKRKFQSPQQAPLGIITTSHSLEISGIHLPYFDTPYFVLER